MAIITAGTHIRQSGTGLDQRYEIAIDITGTNRAVAYDLYVYLHGEWQSVGTVFGRANPYGPRDYQTFIGMADPQIGERYRVGAVPMGEPLSSMKLQTEVKLGYGDLLIDGGYGADLWRGTTGRHDNIAGGSGNDTLRGGIGNDTISGEGGKDVLYGDGGNDDLFGGYGEDQLFGGAGHDTLTGSIGDLLVGGDGNDAYVVQGSVRIVEAANGGIDRVVSTNSINMAANIENLELSNMTDAIWANGNSLDNEMTGSRDDNILSGKNGNDQLFGDYGNDTLNGGNGNDVLDGGPGADVLRGGAGIDTVINSSDAAVLLDLVRGTGGFGDTMTGIENLTSGKGNDTLIGDQGANRLDGGAGRDRLEGGAGGDVLIGGQGIDTMVGGTGSDTYWVDATGDRIIEQAAQGTDVLRGSISIDLVQIAGANSNIETVILTGTAGLRAYGDKGNDNLVGNAGANALSGRTGNDKLTGGAGADTFVFGNKYQQDRILDFQDDIDQIRILNIADVTNSAEARAHATQVGADVLFDFGNGDQLTVHRATIAAVLDDLIFT